MAHSATQDYSEPASNPQPDYKVYATGWGFKLGLLAAFVSILIWASWLVSMRAGVTNTLTPFDLGLLRFTPPALLLLPILWRGREKIKAVSPILLLGIVCGAGVPFFFLSATGLKYAPASHAGLLILGAYPFFVTLLAVIFYQEKVTRARKIGLGLVCTGVIVLLSLSMLTAAEGTWKGDLLLLAASMFWAVYTVSLRIAGLPPLLSTSLMGFVSFVVLLVLWSTGLVSSGLSEASWDMIAVQLVVQSLLVGLMTGFTYGYAVQKLGAENMAAIGAFTPVLASIIAIPILGETLEAYSIVGLGLVATGVLLASGILKKR
ncbi:DMT family transporter [Marinomonas aquiplantarum]|uniref:Drug/metabolite transporter (DMT)-like permease n=1 Tax=Marinomonas aquiplantarum TaxID=491951 RepID=A0A366D9T4_9GAMM|nr:DMT family transporter [Marinomonas aquiplantarum]RBO86018.1 drug/metabolite transporter (DMT)-like permease [Marinomonas aquiplantarum]